MHLLTKMSLACLACGALSCSDDPEATTYQALPEAPEPEEEVVVRDPLYGPEGELLPSETVVGGLPIPRGFDLVSQRDRVHTYGTQQVPPAKVLEYFGQRLFTGSVERMGEGAVYHRAEVIGVENSPRMDVSIIVRGDETRVEIFEIPPLSGNPPSVEEMLRMMEEQQHLLD